MTPVTPDTRHLTASAAVFDPHARLYLVVHHLLTGRWQFPGGHLDPNETGDECAVREVLEETAVPCVLIREPSPSAPNGVDHPKPHAVVEFVAPANPGKGQSGEPEHRHIDLLYLAVADSTATTTGQPDEVAGVRWLPVDQVATADVRADVPPMVRSAWSIVAGIFDASARA